MIKYLFNTMFILCLSVSLQGNDNKIELRKIISKEYPIAKNEGVELSNRYGKISVSTWDKNLVKINVTIIAKSDSKSKAQEKLDQISVDIHKSAAGVSAVTNIEQSSGFFSWNSSEKINFEINYHVYMPSSIALIVENKYGSIMLPEMNNKVSVNLKYGSIEGCNVNGPFMIDLAYSKALMGNTGDLTAEISYSDYVGANAKSTNVNAKYAKVILDNSVAATVNSKYSNLKLGNVGALTFTGQYDDLHLSSLSTGNIDVKYTDVKIISALKQVTATLQYGSFVIQDLATSFTNVNITTSYAPIRIQTKASTNIDVHGSYIDTNFGADFVQKSKTKEGSSTHIQGQKGSGRSKSSIVIDSKYGDVSIY